MLTTILLLFAFSTHDVLQWGEKNGYFYKNVDVSVVKKCASGKFCLDKKGKTYQFDKRDKVNIEIKQKKGFLDVHVIPDNSFISYYLYIQDKRSVRRVKLKKRNQKIFTKTKVKAVQLVATGVYGPVVLYTRHFSGYRDFKFYGSIKKSINMFRYALGLKKLQIEKRFKSGADKRLKIISGGKLQHYSMSGGSIRHSGVRAKVLGENLFMADSEGKAWKMMINSPSHLYNILNPVFTHLWVSKSSQQSEKTPVSGVVVFGK